MVKQSRQEYVTDTLFGPIESRDRANDLAQLLGIAVLALAAIEMPFALLLGPGVVAVAVLQAGLGGIVWWRKSLTAALLLLAVTLAAAVWLLLRVFRGGGSSGAWGLALALVGVWVGGRAVYCAIAFRRLAA